MCRRAGQEAEQKQLAEIISLLPRQVAGRAAGSALGAILGRNRGRLVFG